MDLKEQDGMLDEYVQSSNEAPSLAISSFTFFFVTH